MEKMLLLSQRNRQEIEMIYMSDKGKITQRIIKVLEINEQNFIAYCYLRHTKRTFKTSNILSIGLIRSHRKGA